MPTPRFVYSAGLWLIVGALIQLVSASVQALSPVPPGGRVWSTKSSVNIFSAYEMSPSLKTRWLNSRQVAAFCSGVVIAHTPRLGIPRRLDRTTGRRIAQRARGRQL